MSPTATESPAAGTPLGLSSDDLATLDRELDAYLTFWAEARRELRCGRENSSAPRGQILHRHTG